MDQPDKNNKEPQEERKDCPLFSKAWFGTTPGIITLIIAGTLSAYLFIKHQAHIWSCPMVNFITLSFDASFYASWA